MYSKLVQSKSYPDAEKCPDGCHPENPRFLLAGFRASRLWLTNPYSVCMLRIVATRLKGRTTVATNVKKLSVSFCLIDISPSLADITDVMRSTFSDTPPEFRALSCSTCFK